MRHFSYVAILVAFITAGCAPAVRSVESPQQTPDSLAVVRAATDFFLAGLDAKNRYPVQVVRYEPRPAGGTLVELAPDNDKIRQQGGALTFSSLHEICVERSGETHAISYDRAVAIDSLGCR
jgi:hypothetical protein